LTRVNTPFGPPSSHYLSLAHTHTHTHSHSHTFTFTFALPTHLASVLSSFTCSWLENRTISGLDGDAFHGLIDSHDYIGGLADFTGEVGRFAVAAAAKRDTVAVRESLAADLSVQDALMRLGLPGKLGKKEEMLRTNVKKLEHVLYELSLIKASGRKVTAATTEADGSGGGGAGDERE
jgi:hypothetical protein